MTSMDKRSTALAGGPPVASARPETVESESGFERLRTLYELPLNDLLYQAQTVHRRHFDPNAVQLSTLLSIKTGGCPEDCAYCPQSARYRTGVAEERVRPLERVLVAAAAAKQNGATRFCMGAAWRGPKNKDLEPVLA